MDPDAGGCESTENELICGKTQMIRNPFFVAKPYKLFDRA
jgi:hypothetical protein